MSHSTQRTFRGKAPLMAPSWKRRLSAARASALRMRLSARSRQTSRWNVVRAMGGFGRRDGRPRGRRSARCTAGPAPPLPAKPGSSRRAGTRDTGPGTRRSAHGSPPATARPHCTASGSGLAAVGLPTRMVPVESPEAATLDLPARACRDVGHEQLQWRLRARGDGRLARRHEPATNCRNCTPPEAASSAFAPGNGKARVAPVRRPITWRRRSFSSGARRRTRHPQAGPPVGCGE